MAHNILIIAASKMCSLLKVVKFIPQYYYISFEQAQVPPLPPWFLHYELLVIFDVTRIRRDPFEYPGQP